jgi:hypothetical protein
LLLYAFGNELSKEACEGSNKIPVGNCSLQGVPDFRYLGSAINHNNNNKTEEISQRIKKGNREYYIHKSVMIPKLIIKQTKYEI